MEGHCVLSVTDFSLLTWSFPISKLARLTRWVEEPVSHNHTAGVWQNGPDQDTPTTAPSRNFDWPPETHWKLQAGQHRHHNDTTHLLCGWSSWQPSLCQANGWQSHIHTGQVAWRLHTRHFLKGCFDVDNYWATAALLCPSLKDGP